MAGKRKVLSLKEKVDLINFAKKLGKTVQSINGHEGIFGAKNCCIVVFYNRLFL